MIIPFIPEIPMRKMTVENERPIRLSAWLKARFPRLPGWAFKAALKNKDIRVNGRRIGEDYCSIKAMKSRSISTTSGFTGRRWRSPAFPKNRRRCKAAGRHLESGRRN